MKQKPKPSEVVTEMLRTDTFSQWLGIEVMLIEEGYSKIKMPVREEMINGLGTIHGGIAFSLADSAFAFACNNRNNSSLAIETAISFIKPVMPNDVLVAEAKEIHNGSRTGVYVVNVFNQLNERVALFKGTCLRTGKPLVQL